MAVVRGPSFIPRVCCGGPPSATSDGLEVDSTIANANGVPIAYCSPPMTTAQRDALTPVNMMLIYNTSINNHQYFRTGGGGGWLTF